MKHAIQELIIVSGKGGTGKTSVTAALLTCFADKVFADADVDAADLHLLQKIGNTRTHEFRSGHFAQIREDLCIACGKCEALCRFDAVRRAPESGKYEIRGCEGCKVCVSQCPVHAIEWKEAVAGVWMESETPQGSFIHARLNPGAENSGRLVAHVREEARRTAERKGLSLVVVDGPPGIGCPVISAVTGATRLLIVTEPTPSGLHDLERILQLSKHFRIPADILINKADLSTDYAKKIKDLGESYQSGVIGELPYSGLFSEAQKQGLAVTQFAPQSDEAEKIRQVAQNLSKKLTINIIKPKEFL